MPAHLASKTPSAALPVLQKVWSHLMREDFTLFPSEDDIDEENLPSKILVLSPMVALELIPDFKRGLERGFQLVSEIQKLQQGLQLEWNYLGKNEERGAYLEHLQQFFWQNQDNEQLLGAPEYQKIVEEPWRLLSHLEYFDSSPALPTDYFNQSTTRFIESLTQLMDKWELNPYLLHTDSGSLQWRIQIPQTLELNGCIFAQEEDLWLQIEMQDLTQLA